MTEARYIIEVQGHVQGVWYRQSTLEMARDLGLNGYAMNQEDGSVRIEAEGSRTALERLVTWCRIGPPAARVKEVIVKEAPLQNHPIFHVKH
jgi:acylphosphatase